MAKPALGRGRRRAVGCAQWVHAAKLNPSSATPPVAVPHAGSPVHQGKLWRQQAVATKIAEPSAKSRLVLAWLGCWGGAGTGPAAVHNS